MSRDNPYEGSKYSYVGRTYEIDERVYRWAGWFGAQLSSVEWRRPAPQDTRRILGREFRPSRVVRVGLKWEISWALVGWSSMAEQARMISDLHADLVGGRA